MIKLLLSITASDHAFNNTYDFSLYFIITCSSCFFAKGYIYHLKKMYKPATVAPPLVPSMHPMAAQPPFAQPLMSRSVNKVCILASRCFVARPSYFFPYEVVLYIGDVWLLLLHRVTHPKLAKLMIL